MGNWIDLTLLRIVILTLSAAEGEGPLLFASASRALGSLASKLSY